MQSQLDNRNQTPRIDPLRPYSAPNESGVEGDSSILFPPVHETGSLASIYGTATVSGLQVKDEDLSYAEKMKRKQSKTSLSLDMESVDESPEDKLLYGDRARSCDACRIATHKRKESFACK